MCTYNSAYVSYIHTYIVLCMYIYIYICVGYGDLLCVCFVC